MGGFPVIVAVFAVNAGVLVIALVALYFLNKSVSQSGR